MRTLQKLLYLALFILGFTATQAHAAERVVLLPITGELLASEKSQLAAEAAKALSWQYKIIQGDKVNQFVTKVFREESKKLDCDETSCYRRIASEFKADKIVAIKIAKVASGQYLVTFNLYDVATGEVSHSRKTECTECGYSKLLAAVQSMLASQK
jgi:hypothetical protein